MRLTIKVLAWLMIVFAFQVKAQDQTLINEFNDILNKAETYEKYKVVKTEDMTAFKKSLADSLSAASTSLKGLQIEKELLEDRVSLLDEKLAIAEASLAQSNETNQVIHFLGLPIYKATYHALVWSLVAFLLSILFIGYARIKHACAVVKRVKEAYTRILEEYRIQRFAATEKQMKLKRELQTALNKIEVLQEVEQSV